VLVLPWAFSLQLASASGLRKQASDDTSKVHSVRRYV